MCCWLQPYEPLMLTMYRSGEVVSGAKSERLALSVPPEERVTFVLSRVASTRYEDTDNRTLPENPPKLVTTMVTVVEEPTARLVEFGLADIAKSDTKGSIFGIAAKTAGLPKGMTDRNGPSPANMITNSVLKIVDIDI